ncbi:MAG TPA: hypothetical protein VEF91_03545 [Verrucomicrobiae bacterium]|nr:hypothetical protein [Verrucomicrobiae bacterium]
MEYHKTKDIHYVMRMLGHKNIKDTLIYTQLVTFENADFICKVPENIKEAKELIEAGYEYVTEMDGLKLFRKRKRVCGLSPPAWDVSKRAGDGN